MTLWDPDHEAAPGEPTFTVAELGQAVHLAVAEAFPTEVWVRGEIRDLRSPTQAGHRYFDLIEPGSAHGERPVAKVSVALFRGARERVNATLKEAGGATRMADGIEIRARGRLDWWVGGGSLRFVMSAIDPVFTLGQLEAERARLLARLDQEGLLRRNAARPLPLLPLRVGLVTSRGSAAHADALHELGRSGHRFTVVTADARVQGPDAPRSIVAAMRAVVAHGVDVLLLVRGGGARTDLVAFDTEEVARAIAVCAVPVFTGVGHEIDRSVADEVAHTAAKTPTAAAASVVELVHRAERRLEDVAARVARAGGAGLRLADAAGDHRASRLPRAARTALDRADARLSERARRVERACRAAHREAESRLLVAEAKVGALDPGRLLERGWSITHTLDGRLVRSPRDAPPGTRLRTTLAGGAVLSTASDPDRPEPTHEED